MKTLIELYDERPVENILATEVFHPSAPCFFARLRLREKKKLSAASVVMPSTEGSALSWCF